MVSEIPTPKMYSLIKNTYHIQSPHSSKKERLFTRFFVKEVISGTVEMVFS